MALWENLHSWYETSCNRTDSRVANFHSSHVSPLLILRGDEFSMSLICVPTISSFWTVSEPSRQVTNTVGAAADILFVNPTTYFCNFSFRHKFDQGGNFLQTKTHFKTWFSPTNLITADILFLNRLRIDRLCGLVVRVPGYRSRGPGSISGSTRFTDKYWIWNGVHSVLWVQLRTTSVRNSWQ
jgi:hypothetical protein